MSKYSIVEDVQPEQEDWQASFLVFGVGGGGGNAVKHMVQQNIGNVDFVCANTDLQVLNELPVPKKIQLGAATTRGLGAGANPEVGREAAECDEADIREALEGYDMVFITAGMGGGTGTGAAPVVARIAKEMGILTVAVVTMPFSYEGKKRTQVAKNGVEQLTQYVDSIITIPNEKLLQVYMGMPIKDAFRRADDILLHAVNGLAQTISTAGMMNIDFNDIRTAMTARGHAMMGIGRASGADRARQAAEKAIRSPLLDDVRLENAQGLLVNITASELLVNEPKEIAEVLDAITDNEEGNIFYGFVEDESMGEDIHVTVIATGLTLDDRPRVAQPTQSVAQTAPQQSPAVESAPKVPVRPIAPRKENNVLAYLNNHQTQS